MSFHGNFIQGRLGIGGRFRVFGSVPCPERSDTEASPIGIVTLINRNKGKVFGPDDIVTTGHGFGLVDRGRDDWRARPDSNAKLT
jgi:hypothetical protein